MTVCTPCQTAARLAKWLTSNPGKKNEYNRKWSAANPERERAMKDEWQRNNKAYCAHKTMKYLAQKKKAMPPWADVEKIKAIYQACPKGHHVDHIIPLQGRLVTGLHVESNLQYLPAYDNRSKSNKFHEGNA